MAKFNKDTALEIAYIGAGAVAGKIASEKVYDLIPSEATSALPSGSEVYVKGSIPIAVGLFLPQLAGSSTLVRGIANGMIASGASTIVGNLLEKAGVADADTDVPAGAGAGSEAGTKGVMMGNVMMQGYGNNSVLMGNDGTSDYTPTSYDMTSADAGEMDF